MEGGGQGVQWRREQPLSDGEAAHETTSCSEDTLMQPRGHAKAGPARPENDRYRFYFMCFIVPSLLLLSRTEVTQVSSSSFTCYLLVTLLVLP
jgi:hypothetical protein